MKNALLERGMTRREALKEGTLFLDASGVPEASCSAEALLCFVLGCPRSELYLAGEAVLAEASEKKFQALLQKRAERIPLQYLVGAVDFLGLELSVESGCLIPRPETEGLVEVVLKHLPFASLRVLDVGTGSGNIAIALARARPAWSVVATDISDSALRIAARNASLHRAGNRIRFVHADLWNEEAGGTFDAVVSNPPYLNFLEMESLQPELEFEPREALAGGGADGLSAAGTIIRRVSRILKPEGKIFLEIGCNQASNVSKLLFTFGFCDVLFWKDLGGVDRVVSAASLSGRNG